MENQNNVETLQTAAPVKVGEWMWTTLVAGIPFVGLAIFFALFFSTFSSQRASTIPY